MRVHLVGLAGSAVAVALLEAAPQASVWDAFQCATIKAGTADPTVANPCGHTCPPQVKTDGVIKSCAQLPVDGWWIFRKKGNGLYKSPLRQFSPVMIPNTSADPVTDVDVYEAGEWILYVSNNAGDEQKQKINLIKPDGTRKYTWTQTVYSACWYLAGPNGLEIAYATDPFTSVKVWAVKVDLSGATPQFGTVRQIGKDLGGYAPIHYGSGEFSVRKDHIFIRMRVGKTDKLLHAGMLYTIPNNGMGTASAATVFTPHFGFNCGMDMYKDGTMIVENNARSYADCIIDWHAGFHVLPVKNYNDTTKSAYDWFLGQGISINWSPKTMRDQATLDLHNTHWSNQRNWIATTNIKTLTTADPHGTFLVDWTKNEWYRLAGPNLADADRCYEPYAFITTPIGVDQAGAAGTMRPDGLRVIARSGGGLSLIVTSAGAGVPRVSIVDLTGAHLATLKTVGSGNRYVAHWAPPGGTARSAVAVVDDAGRRTTRAIALTRQ